MTNKPRLSRILAFTVLSIAAITFLLYIGKHLFIKKPNVIILSIDTLRADHLSCYGYPRITSPNIDAFAKNSVLFQKSISQAPLTVPAHMSIFTSLTPPVHQIVSNDEVGYNPIGKNLNTLGAKIETLPLVMKRNGYFTVGLHGGGNVSPEFGFDRGFDAYKLWGDMFKADERISDVREAISASKKKSAPLFIFLHHYICHDPYFNSPQESRGTDLNKCREEFWQKFDLSNARQREQVVSLYDGAINYSDYIFGKLIETLKKENLYDNSIIILVSDHGEEFYEHADKLHWRLFTETLHVPLIIKFPRNLYAGKVISSAVRSMDIMPFLFDFLNIKSRNLIQGVSFLPLLSKGSGYGPCVTSYSLSNDKDNQWAVRLLKNGFAYSNQHSHGVNQWLFNEDNDPYEAKNIVDSHPEITNQMSLFSRIVLEKDAIIRNKIGNNSIRRIDRSEYLEDELKALGYIQ
jgi:arylsulfatase A-like enzyme